MEDEMKTVIYTEAGKIEFPNCTWYAAENSYCVIPEDEEDTTDIIARFGMNMVYGVATEGY
jgi:hypothetical protein